MISVEKREILPVLASSNFGKNEMFARGVSSIGGTIKALFNEDEIKHEVLGASGDGYRYVAEISKRKLDDQRRLEIQQGGNSDFAMFVSDSMMIIDGKPFNRDGNSPEQIQKVLDEINSSRNIEFIGALSFGRKFGVSNFTVLTYFTATTFKDVDSLPISISDLPNFSEKFEAGYISCTSHNGNFEYTKKKQVEGMADNFDIFRPYISALTPELISFGEKSARFEKEYGAIAEALIVDHPFNNMTFYTSCNESQDVNAYCRILQDDSDYFDIHGGSCALFTLALEKQLRDSGLETKIVLYPSDRPVVKNGHSGILAGDGNGSYYFDPGMSIPYPIPVNANIPLFPFSSGTDGKDILVNVADANGDSLPDLYIVRRNACGVGAEMEGEPMLASQVMDRVAYKGVAPEILRKFEKVRKFVKIDFHNADGSRAVGILHKLKSENFVVKIGKEQNTNEMTPEQVSEYLIGRFSRSDKRINYILEQIEKIVELN